MRFLIRICFIMFCVSTMVMIAMALKMAIDFPLPDILVNIAAIAILPSGVFAAILADIREKF